ncbi:MAG: hypothetical protein AAGA69_02910 [Pseudomonadota bacterium]
MTFSIPPYLACDPHATERFPRLLEVVRKTDHPFYRERLAGDAIPLLTRDDILDANDLLLNGHEETARTSGSTGIPVRIAWSPKRRELEQKSNQQTLKWVGAVNNVCAIVHPNNETQKKADFLIDVRTPLDEQIAFIKRRYQEAGAHGITTYPTNAENLAQAVLDGGHDMGFVTCVGVYAEVFEEHQDDLVREAFPNAHVWSSYSSMELGVIAGRCPHDRNFHHVLSRKHGIEILNDRNEPCGEGELGRLVITDYFNGWSPLIRYDIGDMAAPAICSCGNTDMPAISQLAGKIRGALKHRDGRRIPFTTLSVAIRDIPGVRQYQVVQHELEKFELRIVRDDAVMSEQDFHAEVTAKFAREFGYAPRIFLTPETRIERGANGKFYASLSKV